MQKQKIRELIYSKHFNPGYDIKFSDLPKDLKETDIIHTRQDEGYYSENNSWDPYLSLEIYRDRDETDEELSKRIEKSKLSAEYYKKMRYENYLKLKKEFENE